MPPTWMELNAAARWKGLGLRCVASLQVGWAVLRLHLRTGDLPGQWVWTEKGLRPTDRHFGERGSQGSRGWVGGCVCFVCGYTRASLN